MCPRLPGPIIIMSVHCFVIFQEIKVIFVPCIKRLVPRFCSLFVLQHLRQSFSLSFFYESTFWWLLVVKWTGFPFMISSNLAVMVLNHFSLVGIVWKADDRVELGLPWPNYRTTETQGCSHQVGVKDHDNMLSAAFRRFAEMAPKFE